MTHLKCYFYKERKNYPVAYESHFTLFSSGNWENSKKMSQICPHRLETSSSQFFSGKSELDPCQLEVTFDPLLTVVVLMLF